MTSIVGSSQFAGAAKLANTRGIGAVSSNVFDSFGGAPSLLDSAQGLRRTGKFNLGTSQRSRQFRKQLLESSSALTNSLFSLTGGGSATVENNVTKINALRAQNQKFARGFQSNINSLLQDDGGVSEATTGTEVDTEA